MFEPIIIESPLFVNINFAFPSPVCYNMFYELLRKSAEGGLIP